MKQNTHLQSMAGVKKPVRVSRGTIAGFLLASGLAMLLLSCQLPGFPPAPAALVIQIASGMDSRTLVPNVDMNISSYVISGTGPGTATFTTTVSGSTATIPGLVTGAWTVAVDGINADGVFIGHGETTVQVMAGTSQSASISVLPIVGAGSLSLSVTWPAAAVSIPLVVAQLIPSQGSATDLAFTVPESGSSTYSNDSLMNGYYTLILKLEDNGQPVMGAVEIVRIVKGQQTTGSFSFSSVNTARGIVNVNITPQLRNPIKVTLAGNADTIGIGTPMTVTASVPSGTGNTTCVWYLNGTSVATGTSITVNAADNQLAVGTYRLDAVVFTANGLRAGSATSTFSVLEASAVTLAWDANTEADIAGYKLYVGTTIGTYGAPVDAGMATTWTLPSCTSGSQYYFAMTAYNTSGQESVKSAEIAYTAP